MRRARYSMESVPITTNIVSSNPLMERINLFFQGRRICRSVAECKDKDMGIASNRGKADVPRFDYTIILHN
jgi:hypothetical protein